MLQKKTCNNTSIINHLGIKGINTNMNSVFQNKFKTFYNFYYEYWELITKFWPALTKCTTLFQYITLWILCYHENIASKWQYTYYSLYVFVSLSLILGSFIQCYLSFYVLSIFVSFSLLIIIFVVIVLYDFFFRICIFNFDLFRFSLYFPNFWYFTLHLLDGIVYYHSIFIVFLYLSRGFALSIN